MLKYTKLPLLFLLLASLIGVFLRWQVINPTRGVTYSFFLHAHSHIMFLGWVFNALYIAYTMHHIPEKDQRPFKVLFLLLQAFLIPMMVSFPLQGYGLFSIVFSTLHTVTAIAFVIIFFRESKGVNTISTWYAKVSLLFFLISTAGPFSLGYLMSAGLGQSQWYHFSIYYYLHFQYNGFFLFGVFSLFFHLLERKQVLPDYKKAIRIGRWMACSCVPAYLLSVLWAKPGLAFNFTAGVAAGVQVYALSLLISFLKERVIRQSMHAYSFPFLVIAFLSFALKLFLQLLSAHPDIAQFAFEYRPIVIAYIHLVLIAVISLPILIWYLEMDFINRSLGTKALTLFLISFCFAQLLLIAQPWWAKFQPGPFFNSSQLIFLFSLPLSFSCFFFYWAAVINKGGKKYVSPIR